VTIDIEDPDARAPVARAGVSASLAKIVRTPILAGILLLAVYVGLSFLNDSSAYLGTDTGGKIATLDAMRANDSLHPDVGYWAEQWDPQGRVHPLWYASRWGNQWVELSTLPVTYAAVPLYNLGGYHLALLLPMLGGVATAFAARSIARRARRGCDGWAAFWLVGLASPIVIYSLDFWEHTLGVACLSWAVVAMMNMLDGTADDALLRLGRIMGFSALAGLAFGAATTMRTEAFVYALVGTAVPCIVLLRRRGFGPPLLAGAAAVGGALVPIVANVALERWALGAVMRADRAGVTASAPGLGLSERPREALVMFASPFPSLDASAMIIGACLVVLLVFIAVRSRSGGDLGPAKLAAVAVGVIYLVRAVGGLGFVPGLMAATPIAAVGLALGWRRVSPRIIVVIALVSLPLVWAFHSLGGVPPQWAGRYILTSGMLLMSVGVAYLPTLQRWTRRFFIGLAIGVTLFGLAWMSVRTHQMASTQRVLAARPEPVLISGVAHLVREGGSYSELHRWLTAQGHDDQQFAADVAAKAGVDEFGLVQLRSDGMATPQFDGWTSTNIDTVTFFDGVDLRVVTYERSAPAE